MENSLFVVLAMTNPIILLVCWILLKFPPKEINNLYGYRTPRSMRTQECWDYAQPIGAKYLLIGTGIGSLFIPLSLLFSFSVNVGVTISLVVIFAEILVPMYFVERELKRKFG